MPRQKATADYSNEHGAKFRIYPTQEQVKQINKTFGCVRFVYNWGQDQRKKAHAQGQKTGYVQTANKQVELKKQPETQFLQEVDSIPLQQALRDLDRAFVNFYEGRTKFPKYKAKKKSHESYRLYAANGVGRIENNRIKLAKVGWVKIRLSHPIENPSAITVKRTPTGKYFVIIRHRPLVQRYKAGPGQVGIDQGLKTFYTDNYGYTVPNPRFQEKGQRKISREHHRLSKKVYGSANYEKQRKKQAKRHEKVFDQRTDFQHKHSTQQICENQVICTENLDVRHMKQDHRYAGAIHSASWARFVRMIEYKGNWYGAKTVKVPTAFPSSQLCHICGHRNKEVKNQNVRKWTCPVCGAKHDRDQNAAQNIQQQGQKMLSNN